MQKIIRATDLTFEVPFFYQYNGKFYLQKWGI
jgi:hypothetical protein